MHYAWDNVATTPTVYGIETKNVIKKTRDLKGSLVATTPTVYGIETALFEEVSRHEAPVATTPTVYGIET